MSVKVLDTHGTPPQRQKGVALMMVLFVFALVTILAGGMISRQSLFIQKTSNTLIQSQAYELALGAEQLGRQFLYADWNEDKKASVFKDDASETWGVAAVGFPVDYGIIEAQIDDLQGKLNINSLINTDGSKDQVAIERFTNLFIVLNIQELRVEKIIDWIDENNEADGAEGAEENDYLIRETPYRTGNQPFVSISELMLIDGMTEKIYAQLLPHVTVLPVSVKAVNVNTCTKEVYRSLAKGKTLSDEEGQAIIDYRDDEPFKKLEDFKALPEYAGLELPGAFSINSEYFVVSSRVTLSGRVSRLASVLHRDKADGKLTLLSRDQGQKYIITKDMIVAQ
ncbi:type II secretion system minor pseudopilin GspK [Alkalimarinus sediminis]|uniref:Type II secretion system protein K n=1 Tax=Alkalimarinus sediminis TaxID=1632866 RepID=A0A9E8HKB3_9ALTE|nr:type II secretion system minor pseudopilin GspK [Alkalimarinus sediminis]UZW76228.1 type II secretion system minor pseudopilin GspK [Alkalimarinus sediminis]